MHGAGHRRGDEVGHEGDRPRAVAVDLVHHDHHVLGIHHVRTGGNEAAWDVAFLAFGALLTAGGWALARSAAPRR